MTREEALEIASHFDKVAQCSYFITFLGYPPIEALHACEINLDNYL